MKLRKSILVALTIFGLLTLCTMNANAAPQWYTCSVLMAGPNLGGSVNFQLTDTAATPAFTAQWCHVPPAQANAFLATALTAISNNMNVTVRMDLAVSPTNPPCEVMYLRNK